jgi:hypothetical protein
MSNLRPINRDIDFLMPPSVGKLDTYLSPEQREQVIEVVPGDRTVTVTEKL